MTYYFKQVREHKNWFELLNVTRKMSKRVSKKGAKSQKPIGNELAAMVPVTLETNGNVAIKIQAKPGAKHNNVTDITSEGIGIAISAPPVDGEANTELVKYVASVLGVKKSDVSINRGMRSRQKVAIVCGITVDDVLKKLKAEMDA